MGNSLSEEEEEEAGNSSQQVRRPQHAHQSHNEMNNNGRMNPIINSNVKLPHNCVSIAKNSDSPIDTSSVKKLYEQLHAGIYLNGRRKKYWVEKENINCFMVFANDLSISWGDNPQHWYLHTEKTSDDGKITVAQLRNISWLDVHGKFNTENLSPGVTYQVSYVIMLEHTAYGWQRPVNFRLTLPNGKKQEHKENLDEKPRGNWIQIIVGEFKASPENLGEIDFSLYEHEGGNWKKGLIIKGATILPKHH